MAKIEALGSMEELFARTGTLTEPELIGQQLMLRGCIHMLKLIQAEGCGPEAVQTALEQVFDGLACVEQVAASKGWRMPAYD